MTTLTVLALILASVIGGVIANYVRTLMGVSKDVENKILRMPSSVKVEADAFKLSTKETAASVKEVQNESVDDLLARARKLLELGRSK